MGRKGAYTGLITDIIYAIWDYFERRQRRKEAMSEFIRNGWKSREAEYMRKAKRHPGVIIK